MLTYSNNDDNNNNRCGVYKVRLDPIALNIGSNRPRYSGNLLGREGHQ